MTKALLRSTPRKRGAKTIPPREAEADENNHAALYRLMAWLSPAYPIGAFSYSSGIEWAVEAGDIKDAETLRQWLDSDDGRRQRLCAMRCSSRTRIARRRRATMPRFARVAELAAALRVLERALSGNDGAGPRLSRGDARGMAVPGARPPRSGMARPGRAADRRRHDLRRARHRLRAGARCLPARDCARTGFPPACGLFRSARPTASAFWPRWSPSSRRRRRAPGRRRSTRSAPRRSAPTSPACATRSNTRGCSRS